MHLRYIASINAGCCRQLSIVPLYGGGVPPFLLPPEPRKIPLKGTDVLLLHMAGAWRGVLPLHVLYRAGAQGSLVLFDQGPPLGAISKRGGLEIPRINILCDLPVGSRKTLELSSPLYFLSDGLMCGPGRVGSRLSCFYPFPNSFGICWTGRTPDDRRIRTRERSAQLRRLPLRSHITRVMVVPAPPPFLLGERSPACRDSRARVEVVTVWHLIRRFC